MNKQKELIVKLAAKAGVAINGQNPWDIQVKNEEFYARVLRNPYLGIGESYMDGWWNCQALDQFIFKMQRANLESELKTWSVALHFAKAAIFSYGKKSKSTEVTKQHYDIGNDLYVPMLGKSMAYTCAYWKNAKSLDEAQEQKYDLVCRKIGLKPGMTVLDLGCGFGGFLKFAAEKYQISGVGVNLSKEQVKFARQSTGALPLEFLLADYREARGEI